MEEVKDAHGEATVVNNLCEVRSKQQINSVDLCRFCRTVGKTVVPYLSGLERGAHNAKVAGSNPAGTTNPPSMVE